MGAFGSLVDASGSINRVSDIADNLFATGFRVLDRADFVLNALNFGLLVRGWLRGAHGSALVRVPAGAGSMGRETGQRAQAVSIPDRHVLANREGWGPGPNDGVTW